MWYTILSMNKTIKADCEELIEIKKSKFIGYAFFCENVEQATLKIKQIRLEHKKATHVCFAYVIGTQEKASDDGEPQGTAGVPILEIIKKQNLKNVLIIVVRYFGGIKLGAGGLVRAYGESALSVIKKSGVADLLFANEYEICVNYGNESVLNNLKNNKEIINLKVEYNEKIKVTFLCDGEFNINEFKQYNLKKIGEKLIRK